MEPEDHRLLFREKEKKHYKLKAQAPTEDPVPNLDELRTFSPWRDLYELFPSNHAMAHGDVFRSWKFSHLGLAHLWANIFIYFLSNEKKMIYHPLNIFINLHRFRRKKNNWWRDGNNTVQANSWRNMNFMYLFHLIYIYINKQKIWDLIVWRWAKMKIKTSSVTPHKALTTIITRVCIPAEDNTPHA